MKIKTVLMVVCLCWATIACVAQDSYSEEYLKALRDGARAKITVLVSAPRIGPVSNATMNVFFEQRDGNQYMKKGKTDTLGTFTVEGMTRSSIGGGVTKEGFYRSVFRLPFATGQERVSDGHWLPWNPTIPVVLREVCNPIPMYATGIDFSKAFPCNTDVGFDCEKRDWVDPHGTGAVSDFIVKMVAMEQPEHVKKEVEEITAAQDAAKDRNAAAKFNMDLRRIDRAYYRLVISSIDDGGGFIRKRKTKGSDFVSDYEAPVDGYTATFTTSMEKLPYFEPPNPDDLSGGEYLIFKSRIQRDGDGKIVSANYGKIYGPLEHIFSRHDKLGALKFIYYFNPTPNDRNLEFDASNNLYVQRKGEHAPLNRMP